MRVRFNNVAMAAAFIGGALTQSSKSEDYQLEERPDLADLPDGPCILEVLTSKQDDGITYIDITDDSEDTESTVQFRIPTVQDLNFIIDRIIPPNNATNSKRGTSVRGHDVIIHRDGSLSVGCKSFSKDDVERVVRVAKRVKSGLSFTEFTTSTRHRIRPNGSSPNRIAIDADGVVTPEEVEQIAKERDEFLASSQQASIQAFNLLA